MIAPALGVRGAVASALTAAAGWLVEPAEPVAEDATAPAGPAERPVVAVIGVAPASGATVVARALGAELAARDEDGACAVTAPTAGGSVPLGLPAAGRLARWLAPATGLRTRACGRLCLIECDDGAALASAVLYRAPLVLDVSDARETALAAALADTVVLVAAPRAEPSLAAVMAESLARIGPEPLIVLNRAPADDSAPEAERWSGRASAALPESRMGAQLALAGREPRGELGRAVGELVDRIESRG